MTDRIIRVVIKETVKQESLNIERPDGVILGLRITVVEDEVYRLFAVPSPFYE